MKIGIPLPGGSKIEFGIIQVTDIDLSELDQATLDGIEKSRKDNETFGQAATRLIVSGMMTEAYRIGGADIIEKRPDGQETIIFPAEKKTSLI